MPLPTQSEAWASLSESAKGALRGRVYAQLAAALPGGLTDMELLARMRATLSPGENLEESSSGRRRGELVSAGCVRDTGETRRSPSGRRAVVWAVCAPYAEWSGPPDSVGDTPASCLLEACRRLLDVRDGKRDGLDPRSYDLLLAAAVRAQPALRGPLGMGVETGSLFW